VADDRSTTDQALDLLVYGPLGLAMYVRDTAPSFLRLFVARGRAVVDGQRKSVEGQLGQARSVGEFASSSGGPYVWKLVQDGLEKVRLRTEEALETLGTIAGTVPSPVSPAGPPRPSVVPDEPARPPGGSGSLAIRDYDELSASQVVDRLDGLSPAELDAIRDYETSHRARNTVLGKIEQLTRPAS
jgi:hypothetical protein